MLIMIKKFKKLYKIPYLYNKLILKKIAQIDQKKERVQIQIILAKSRLKFYKLTRIIKVIVLSKQKKRAISIFLYRVNKNKRIILK